MYNYFTVFSHLINSLTFSLDLLGNLCGKLINAVNHFCDSYTKGLVCSACEQRILSSDIFRYKLSELMDLCTHRN